MRRTPFHHQSNVVFRRVFDRAQIAKIRDDFEAGPKPGRLFGCVTEQDRGSPAIQRPEENLMQAIPARIRIQEVHAGILEYEIAAASETAPECLRRESCLENWKFVMYE